MKVVAAAILIITFLCTIGYSQDSTANTWHYLKTDDPLQGPVDVFVLLGTYLSSPRSNRDGRPGVSVLCMDGKFTNGRVSIGALLDSDGVSDDRSTAFVQIRRDDGKSQVEQFPAGSDMKSLNIKNERQLVEFLTGQPNGRLTDKTRLLKKIVIGASEAFGGVVIMQFNMPPDIEEMIRICGLK